MNWLRLTAPIPVFFLLLLLLQIVFLPGLLTRGDKVVVPHRTIIVGGEFDRPPYEYLDENGEPAGYNVDLTLAIATEMGVDIELVMDARPVVEQQLMDGQIDVLQGVREADAVKAGLLFFPDMAVEKRLFSHRRPDAPLTALRQLAGRSVAVKKDGGMHRLLAASDYDFRVVAVNTEADALRAVATGESDYALVATLSTLYLSRHLQYLEKDVGRATIFEAGHLAPDLRYGFAALPQKAELLKNLRESLDQLNRSGIQREIRERWLGSADMRVTKRAPNNKNIVELIFSPLILIVCTVAFWNRSLTKEVERRSAELALRHQQLLQADKMASLGTLVSGVAHEINNPTGLILYNLPVLENIYRSARETLEQRYRDEGDFFIGGLRYSLLREESEEVFAELKGGATRIKQIVNDLKDFVRNDSVDLDDLVRLDAVVDAAIRLVCGSLKKAKTDCRIDKHYAADIPDLVGNRHRIEQVVINLLLNAFQALTATDQTVTVRIFTDREQGEVVVSVTDEGIGIPADQIDKLTDPFFTTKRESGGTGLGLSVSAGIVAEHRGRLLFDSEPGAGTTVSLCLPLEKEDKS